MAESRRDEIAKLEALYASNPEGRVFTHLAEAYRRAGELDRARDILERGLQRHPDYPSAHVVLGRVLADQGRDDEAAAAFRRVLDLDPENLIARRSLAEAARAAGRDEDALTHYRALLANDPGAQDIREIATELETRLHAPPARPAAPPPAEWGMVQAQETWDAAPPVVPMDGMTDFAAMTPPAEPAVPDAAPIDAAPLDLSGIDFGFGPEPTQQAGEPAAPDAAAGATHETAAEGVEEPLEAAAPGPTAFGDREQREPVAFGDEEPEPAAELDVFPEQGPPDVVSAPPYESAAAVEPVAPFEPAASAPEPEQAPEPEPAPEPAPAAAYAPAPAQGPTVIPGAPAAPAEPYGVPTETLATLYQAQGFPDRAAAIYRVLVRERPYDEGLQARARAAEEAAAAMRAQRTGIEENREVWVSGDDAGAQSLPAHAWGGGVDDDEPLDTAAGPSIGEYLQRVLAWRPSEPVAPAPGAPGAIAATAAQPAAPAAAAPRAPDGEPASVSFAFEEPEERPGPWEPDDTADELDTLDGFVFGGEEEPAAVAPEREASAGVAPDAHAAVELEPAAESPIEYGYGIGPGEEAYGAEDRTGAPAEAMEPPAGASIGFGAPGQPAEPPEGLEPVGSDLHLDTLLPLPREGAEEAEEPTTWFEPEHVEPDREPRGRAPLPFELEPAGGAPPFGGGPAPADDEGRGEPLPFDYEPAGDEGAGEPLPFALESIGTGVEEPAGEPLPFELDAIGADVEDDAGEPLPFETMEAAAPFEPATGAPFVEEEPPFAITPDEPLAGDEGMLELEEADSVSESAAPPAPSWDPTIALADVEAQPRQRPEAKLRYEPPARPAQQPPLTAARADDEEGEDEDLEMFRAWLQSLKR